MSYKGVEIAPPRASVAQLEADCALEQKRRRRSIPNASALKLSLPLHLNKRLK